MKGLSGLVLTPKEFELLAELCERDPRFPSTWQIWNDELKAATQGGEAGNPQPTVRLSPHLFRAWCARVGIAPCVDAVRAFTLIHRAPLSTVRYGALALDSRSMGLDAMLFS